MRLLDPTKGGLMPYHNVDDQLCWHRKTIAAGNQAMGVWVRCASWAAGQKQDGYIPEDVARAIAKPADIAALTVPDGLWEKVSGGYQMHDYADHNMTAAEQKLLSEKRAKAGRIGGSKRPSLRSIRSGASDEASA
jgi:hypothetical protein